MNVGELRVESVPFGEVLPWLLGRHYAKRTCPVSHAFGAFDGTVLVGVVTYGVPSSAPLRSGLCGPEWRDNVLELNRLCCENQRNVASVLVGRSLRMLPAPRVVVSYADTGRNHVGYVYQATNFLYTGLSAVRTDWRVKGEEHLHGATVADRSRGKENRAEWMRETYGDRFYLEARPRKHRYVFFVGNRYERKAMRSALRYPVEKYPKGESAKYDTGTGIQSQSVFEL